MILARFNKQVIRPDFQAFGQVDRKFNNSPVYVGLRQTLDLKPNSSNFISTSRKVVNLWLFQLRISRFDVVRSKSEETRRSFGCYQKSRTHHQYIEDKA